MAPSSQRAGAAVEIERGQEVVALDLQAARPAGAPHDDVLEVDEAFGSHAGLDAPVGRRGREKSPIAVGDDVRNFGMVGHDRRAQPADLDGELIHAAPPARPA